VNCWYLQNLWRLVLPLKHYCSEQIVFHCVLYFVYQIAEPNIWNFATTIIAEQTLTQHNITAQTPSLNSELISPVILQHKEV